MHRLEVGAQTESLPHKHRSRQAARAEADRHGLKILNLRRMLTGVLPDKHGIPMNQPFDPERHNQEGWYWYAEDIHVPTLWEAAAR